MKHVLWTAALGLMIGLVGCGESKPVAKPAPPTAPAGGHMAGPPAHTEAKPDEAKPDEAKPDEGKPEEPAAPTEEKPEEKPEGDKPEEAKPE
ncbi:MAG TPA: hypothetical protein VHB77_01195 [Planctomycetaceae bacterium]|nr:hypothetical protein [Planctomycetaceae bacterium]